MAKFSCWRNLQIGRYRESKPLRYALEDKGIKMGHVANYSLDNVSYRQVARYVDLALVSVSDLGFSEPTPYSEIVISAQALGLSLCPGEVGAELCLQRPDVVPKEEGRELRIAMKPLMSNTGSNNIYILLEGGLYVCRAEPHDKSNPEDQFIFVIPQS